MKVPHPYLPELDWTGFDTFALLPTDFMELFADAALKEAVRGPSARVLGGLQAARHRVTAIAGRTVLKVTKNKNMCAVRGHPIRAKAWVEVPGHYENWFRVVGCECGKLAHLQTASHHQDPSLSFLPPRSP